MRTHTTKEQPIILIGPCDDTGETVGKLLATQLDIPYIDLWEGAQPYCEEIGFQQDLVREAQSKDGAEGVYRYLIPFVTHAIKRGVTENRHRRCVVKLGSLQSVIDDDVILQGIAGFLKSFSVILLLPSEGEAESARIMRERNSTYLDGKELNEHFLSHRSNADLAKLTVHTKSRTPDQTAEDVLARIDSSGSEIILIGAEGVGKSTIARLIAGRLGIPRISMDELRWKYYEEVGWSSEEQEKIGEKDGFAGVYRYWKQFDVHAVQRILSEHKNCVIDFGAGHSVHERAEDLAHVSELLAPYPNVVLLMPTSDTDESAAILSQRRAKTIGGVEMFEFIISHPSNRQLASHLVYTEGRTAIETSDAIHRYLDST